MKHLPKIEKEMAGLKRRKEKLLDLRLDIISAGMFMRRKNKNYQNS